MGLWRFVVDFGLYVVVFMGRANAWMGRCLASVGRAGAHVSTPLKILGFESNDKALQQEAACAMYQVLIDA